MLDDEKLARLMDMATADDKRALLSMLSEMDEVDKAFFRGYIIGYGDGVSHANAAAVDGFVGEGYNSPK